MGPIDLYLAPAELDYRRERRGAPRYRPSRRKRTMTRLRPAGRGVAGLDG